MRNTSQVKPIIQIHDQSGEEYIIVPPNPMVARRMNVVVFRLHISGATRPKVLFSAGEHPTFPITIHYYLYSLWLMVEMLFILKVP
jgi:hypothetical protein